MSRDSSGLEKEDQHATNVICSATADDMIVQQARSLYGGDAATAIAFCGIDAWLDGDDAEFRRWARMFRKVGN